MGKVAFVFPGQGSQTIGMGKDLFDNFLEVRKIYEQANNVVGFSLSDLCFNGPEQNLRQTVNTQPALLATSMAILEAMDLFNVNIKADYMAGHSLGEYSALVAAGGISYKEAIQLVHKRGQFMEQAAANGVGKMAAILGMEADELQSICDEINLTGNYVQLANLNCPGQIIISGDNVAVDSAGELAKERGAKRVINLEVSGPFHSKLMLPAKENLSKIINDVNFKDTKTPVISNVTAQAITDSNDIKNLLLKQITSAVLWEDSINYLLNKGVTTFIEVGPGKVLAGLIKKIDRNVNVYNVFDIESIRNLSKEVI